MPSISVKVIIKWSWISWVSCWEALRVSVFLPFRNQQKISKIVVFWLRFTKRSKSFKEKRHPKILIFFHLVISWLCGKHSCLSPRRVGFNSPSFYTFFLFLLNLILYQQIILFLTLSKFCKIFGLSWKKNQSKWFYQSYFEIYKVILHENTVEKGHFTLDRVWFDLKMFLDAKWDKNWKK